MKRAAVAYVSNGFLIVAPVVTTTAGVGLEVDPVRLDDPRDAVSIGAALAEALGRSRHVMPHPPQEAWKGFFRSFQEAAGVRSLKAFMKNAKSVGIEAGDDRIQLTPYRNLGTNAGFEEMPDAAVSLAPEDMAGAVRTLQALLFTNGA